MAGGSFCTTIPIQFSSLPAVGSFAGQQQEHTEPGESEREKETMQGSGGFLSFLSARCIAERRITRRIAVWGFRVSAGAAKCDREIFFLSRWSEEEYFKE